MKFIKVVFVFLAITTALPSAAQYLQADRLDIIGRTHDPELLMIPQVRIMQEQLQLLQRANYVELNASYAYVNQNPVNLIDPEGLGPRSPTLWCPWCGAPHGGSKGDYCPDCDSKSKDPNGGVPPNTTNPDDNGTCPNGDCHTETQLVATASGFLLIFILVCGAPLGI